LVLRADLGLILAGAGPEYERCVRLGQQVAVGHRIAACTTGIGTDATVERKRILQSVKLALGEGEYASAIASRIRRSWRSMLYRHGHELNLIAPGRGKEQGDKPDAPGDARPRCRPPLGRRSADPEAIE